MPSIARAAIDQVAEVLLSRAVHNAKNCTKDTCSVKDSVYGYYPSKPVNIILVAIFAISMFAHFYQGIRSKSWTFLVALGIGTFGEAVGTYGMMKMYGHSVDDAQDMLDGFYCGVILSVKHSTWPVEQES